MLLIEDDEIDRMAFRRAMAAETTEYDCYFAESVQGAKELLKEGAFDVVVADYKLADGTAFDLFDLMADTPFIFATGGGDEETAVKALRAGAYDYLIKDHRRNYLKVLPLTLEKAYKQKQMNERLRLMETAVVNSQDAVAITNGDIMDLRFTYVNGAFEQMTGYKAPEVLGKPVILLLGEKTDKQELGRVFEMLKKKEAFRSEIINYKADGSEFWKEMNITPLFAPDGKVTHYVSIERDVTERKNAEQELLLAKKQADAAREAQQLFLANISHEIRTPMNAVIGMTHFLMESNPNPEQTDYLQALKFSADNLLALINDVLDFSKIEAGQLILEQTNFDLRALLQDVTQTFRFKMKQNADVLVHESIAPNIPKLLLGDPMRLTQILNNLLGNAGKFTEKGDISLAANILEVPGSDRCWVGINIKDTGIGMSQITMDSIYDKFKQADASTSRRYGGTGLGLAIVKELVDLHGGKISVESTVGKGTTFSVVLPFAHAVANEVEMALDASEDINQLVSNTIRQSKILVVEDNPMNQKLIRLILEQWGCDYRLAENGRIALDFVQNGSFDIVLMDIQMPVMDGYETTKAIRAMEGNANQHIPIIALSATTVNSEKDKIFAAGMDSFLSKPFTPNKLKKAVFNSLHQRSAEKSEDADVENRKQPIFDFSHIKSTFGGNNEFVKEMVQIFLEENPKDLADIEKYLNEKNADMLRRAAHKIKSGYLLLQMNELHALAFRVEMEASSIRPQYETLHQIFQRLTAESTSVYGQLKQAMHALG